MNITRIKNRRGITLLFVISMIVLFLLMGTTFIVLANDFLRSSRRHSRITSNTIESLGENRGERFIQHALYDLLRGPDLNDVNSPLRGHSILEDMYGYGYSSYVKTIETTIEPGGVDPSIPSPTPQFIRLELIGPDANLVGSNEPISIDDFNDPTIFGNDLLTGNKTTYAQIGDAPGRFNGQLLSFVTGAARGITSRIIDHQVFPTGGTLRHKFVVVLLNPPADVTPGNTNDLIVTVDSVVNGAEGFPTRVVINSRPFAGTGVGRFDPAMANSNSMPALSEVAFNPNQRGKTREDLYGDGIDNGYLAIGAPGGMPSANLYAPNECYDAADFQNMFLASVDEEGQILIPSFHRTNLEMLSSGDLTEYSFRPEFRPIDPMDPYNSLLRSNSGCSSRFPGVIDSSDDVVDFTARELEVDNDGDNEEDGIWMDIGIPIYTNKEGRRIKSLVSYLVLDGDSRININVHGNLAQIPDNDRFARRTIANGFLSPTNTAPFGMGMGTSEIYLGAVVGDVEAERLMVGTFSSGNNIVLPGRYGSSENNLRRDIGGGPVPGRGYVNDMDLGREPFSAYKQFGYPTYGLDPLSLSVLGGLFQSSPMDIYGRFRIGYPSTFFDSSTPFQTSMPVIDVTESDLVSSEIINNPYEVNFPALPATGSFYDQLFTAAEMESIYRQHDNDVKQRPKSRLTRLNPSDPSSSALAPSLLMPENRLSATTDSWEVSTTYQEFLGTGNNGRLETLMTKLYRILSTTGDPNFGVPDNGNPIQRQQIIYANMTGFVPESNETFSIDPGQRGMLSADVRSGRPFDVNQPFGDGLADLNNGDQVVDNPGEIDRLLHPNGTDYPFDHDNDGFIADNNVFARQLYARQLYILALLATEVVDRNGDGNPLNDFNNFVDPTTGVTLFGQAARLAYRKMVAQWAINVVDFRDPDSTMTPFEVDLNPWDGWDVDGDFSTNEVIDGSLPLQEYARLWGCERPELLITENLVLHDRREEDRDDDNGGMDDLADGDEDMDSRLVPNASAFFELYHPHAHTVDNSPDPQFPNQFLPGEFDPNQNGGVDLQQLAPNGAPVWRMVVVNNAQFNNNGLFQVGTTGYSFVEDPDDLLNPQNLPDMSIRRFVYFATPDGLTGDQFNGPRVYAPPASVANSPVIQPGGYAIIGSAGIRDGDTYTTYIGRRRTAAEGTATSLELDQTRRIVLDTDNNTVSVFPGDANTDSNTRSAIVLPLNSVTNPDRSFGVTDPTNGYADGVTRFVVPIPPDPGGDGFMFVDDAGVPIVLDEPVDKTVDTSPMDAFYTQVIEKDQHVNAVFVVLLQRLANPLAGWNRETNPYLTVDSTSADVFAFNGVAIEPNNNGPNPLHLGTFERRSSQSSDNHGQAVNPLRSRMLWKTDYSGLNPDTDTQPSDDDSHWLNTELVHSLGGLNRAYEMPDGIGPPDPQLPFAWLTWNNRPFASALELVNVPYTSSYFLTNRFDVSLRATGVMNNVYQQPMPPNPPEFAIRFTAQSGEFPHLLNFHADVGNNSLQLHRIFDYIEVPSRYIGTTTYLNPGNFISTLDQADNVRHSMAQAFAPPYDVISSYRQPGKININTATNPNVWNGLMGGDPAASPGRVTFDLWRTSRDNWTGGGIPNPYRVANARNLVPESMNSPFPVPGNRADVGLFRRQSSSSNQPLFDYDPMNDPLNNTDRNAYFRYNERQRLGNLVTMRSSVFLIWVTVGYFEVETHDAVDDMGNVVKIDTVGAEVVDENDQTTRNRGFFIFDRSIPVAFEPGKNHNVERAIRVSSYIE